MRFGWPEILLVVIALVLLFGASRLPQLARSIGQSRKAFKDAFRDGDEDDSAGSRQIDAGTTKADTTSFTDEEILAEMQRAEPNQNLRPRMHSVGSEFMFLSMFLFIFDSPVQIAMVIGVIVLLFGAGRLPQLAKSLGQSRKAFKEGMREAEEADAAHPIAISANSPAPQITQMTDEDLMAEMRRRVEAKQS